ncbi:hypothetical protein LguiA_011615 [Lonicera macranthoides]
MLSPSGSSNYALVYDYKVNQWQQFNGFKTIFGDNYHQRGVYHNAQLYFATPESFSILCFDLENGYWEGSMTQLPSQLTFVLLMSSGSGNSICNNDFIVLPYVRARVVPPRIFTKPIFLPVNPQLHSSVW